MDRWEGKDVTIVSTDDVLINASLICCSHHTHLIVLLVLDGVRSLSNKQLQGFQVIEDS